MALKLFSFGGAPFYLTPEQYITGSIESKSSTMEFVSDLLIDRHNHSIIAFHDHGSTEASNSAFLQCGLLNLAECRPNLEQTPPGYTYSV